MSASLPSIENRQPFHWPPFHTNGKETLQRIKKDDRYNHILVVIYSTFNDSRLSRKCLDIGATQIITKPDTFEGSQAMIEMLIQKYCHSH